MPYRMAREPKPMAASMSDSMKADIQKKQIVKRIMPIRPIVLMTFMSSPCWSNWIL